MSLTVQKNTSITRNLTTKVNDKEIVVARMTGQVAPEASMTLSVAIADKEQAAAHGEDLAAAFNAFVAEMRIMAAENGLPM